MGERTLQERLPQALDGERLDRVVALMSGVSRSEASALVAAGTVLLDGAAVTARSARVSAGQVVEISLPPESEELTVAAEPDLELAVAYDDDDLVVVLKPAGLVVHPGAGNRSGTLVNAALARYPEIAAVGDPLRPGVVHRLDKETSGLLVLARSAAAYEGLVRQFAARSVEREYQVLVWGHLDHPAGVVDAAIGRSQRDPTRMAVSNRGREARTRYEVLETYREPAPLSLLSCRLETGRTHQIRVHLAAIGHPVVGDARYGGARQQLRLGRLWLHAGVLGFAHPRSGEPLRFTAALPEELAEALAQLR